MHKCNISLFPLLLLCHSLHHIFWGEGENDLSVPRCSFLLLFFTQINIFCTSYLVLADALWTQTNKALCDAQQFSLGVHISERSPLSQANFQKVLHEQMSDPLEAIE